MAARPHRYGIVTFAAGAFEPVAQLWRTAEALGFDQAWVVDDMLGLGPYAFEPWTLLAALARETARMRIGTLVTPIAFRHPTLPAAEGRLVKGAIDPVAAQQVSQALGHNRLNVTTTHYLR